MQNLIWKVKSFPELQSYEMYEILKVRQEVFIVEQTCYYLDADGYDDAAIHIWAELEGKIVCYCRVFPQNIKYDETSIGRVLTHPVYRALKLGRKMMDIAIQTIVSRFNSESIRISAQDYLIDFYESFGFNDTGKKYLEDDIPHTEMLRN